ncbi:hypothetical protein V6N13_026118 [Hibiscus sabdariffa]
MAKLGIILFVAIVFVLGFSFREVVAHSGTATFYTAPYVPSACYGYEDDGVMIAAASDAIWDGGAVCGRQYKVKCKGATNESPHPCRGQDYVVVKIVDYCPSGCQGTIDLSQEAFAAIADPDAGKIKIYFHQYVDLGLKNWLLQYDISLLDMFSCIFYFQSESSVCAPQMMSMY